MTATEQTHLQGLQATFDATDLGEGDPVAGLNLLAAMAFSLANIAPPGSGLQAKDGKTFVVGTSFTVSGALSSSLVTDSVVVGMGEKQNNYHSQLRRYCDDIYERSNKLGFKGEIPPSDLGTNAGQDAFFDAQRREPVNGGAAATEAWKRALGQPASPRIDELRDHSLVFLTADRATDLEKQLARSHMGRPLVYLGLNKASEFKRFEELCPKIMDAWATPGSMTGNVRGTVMVSDPSGVLGDVLRANDQGCRWVERLVWLVDSPVGPEPSATSEGGTPVALGTIDQRYEAALSAAWAERLNSRSAGPKILEWEFTKRQARWIAFLKKMEPDFPGITGTARKLLSTLLFGLEELVGAGPAPKGFKLYITQIEAFAQFLVHRMVNTRGAVRHSAENARLLHTQAQILDKLADGPHGVRSLCRRAHRLRSEPCLEALYLLKDAGEVVRDGNEWKLTKSAQGPLIEV